MGGSQATCKCVLVRKNPVSIEISIPVYLGLLDNLHVCHTSQIWDLAGRTLLLQTPINKSLQGYSGKFKTMNCVYCWYAVLRVTWILLTRSWEEWIDIARFRQPRDPSFPLALGLLLGKGGWTFVFTLALCRNLAKITPPTGNSFPLLHILCKHLHYTRVSKTNDTLLLSHWCVNRVNLESKSLFATITRSHKSTLAANTKISTGRPTLFKRLYHHNKTTNHPLIHSTDLSLTHTRLLRYPNSCRAFSSSSTQQIDSFPRSAPLDKALHLRSVYA